MGFDINLHTSKVDVSQEDGIDVDLYTDKLDINEDNADDIIIEITGLKSLSKFIGLEDTPLYYDNGKFFKVENNKIVYTDIEWKDISGDISESPEIIAVISDLINEVASDIVDERINLHNLNEEAHPYIQNTIQENYNTLDTKIDDTKEELSQDILNLNDALNQEISDRETADNALSEDIQEEILARIEGDTTLQGEIDTLNTNLQNEINARIEGDTNLSNSLDELSDNLIQEVLDRQEQDGVLQEQITSNYNTLDGKIDTEISNRTSADTTLQDNIDAEALTRQNADTELQNNIDELTQTVEDNNTAVNSRIDETNDTVSDLTDTVTSNYNTLDGKIDTEISNRTSADTTLQNNIDTEALTRQNADSTLQGNINTLSDTVSSNYNDLSDQIDNLSDTVSDNYIDLDDKISDLTDTVNDNDTAINSKVDGINTTLTTSINNLSNTVTSNYTTLDTKIDNTKTSLEGDISDLSDTVNQNYTDLSNAITTSASTINSRIDGEVSTLNTAIGTETTNRQNADNNLQSQIDAIVSSSDVFDIVGTYAELQAYDITIVPANDIIKVLIDNTHDGSATYYRCIENEGIKSWLYIGSEGAYYTKSESDTRFVNKNTTINNIPLSSNITLTASDVNALPDTTVIGDGVLTLQKNGVNIDTFNANATANKSINITVPTDTADLTNGAGFITSASLPTVNNGTLDIQVNGTSVGTFTANQSGNTTANIVVPDSATWGNITGTLSNQIDLQNALNSKYDASNPDGYITTSDLPTNYVTTDTAQDISGRKTFLGEKAIYFKQNATTDKLGFTLYNPSNTELGALEYRPNTINGNALLALNCPQSGSNYVGFRYWSGINIVAPRPTTNGNYFIPVNVTDGTNTVTANNSGTLNISSLLPDVSDMATQTWVTNQGYTTNVGTVTSVNNIQPDASGNVTLTIPDTVTWGNITGTLSDQTDLQNALDTKQGTISDLSTIRSGATLGATALQPNDNITELVNNAGYITGITSSDVTTALGYTPYNSTNPSGYITSADLPTNHVTTDTAQSISGQKTFTSTIKSSVNNSLALTQSTGETFGVTVTRTDANNEIKFGIGTGGDNRGIWDVRHNKWAFNITDNGKAYALGNEIAVKSDLNSLSPLRYSRYSIASVNSTNKFIKLASMTHTEGGNRDFSYLFWVEILEASTAKCYALVRLSARWSNTSYTGHKFEILEKYGEPVSSLEALKNLTYAYSLDTTTHKITAEIWLEIRNVNYISYYLRPTECNEYGDYSNTPVTLSNNIWTYYEQSGNASSIASTAITSGLTQVKVTDATGVRNENDLSQVIKYWTGTKAQYNAITTKDPNTLYNITDDNTADAYEAYTKSQVNALIQDALYYKSGDTFENISFCECPAVVTSSGTSVRIGITTPKRLDNITSVTCNSLVVSFRKSTGGYAPSTPWDAKANATSLSCTIGASNMLYIWVNYDNYGFTNNTPVGCELKSFSFTFT